MAHPPPLGGIGTLKCIEDAKELIKFIAVYMELKHLHEIEVLSKNLMRDLFNEVKIFTR